MDRKALERFEKEIDRVNGLNFMRCGRCHQTFGVQFVNCKCDGSKLTWAESQWVRTGGWTVERQDKKRREDFDAAMRRAAMRRQLSL
jgi:hypothetical protein